MKNLKQRHPSFGQSLVDYSILTALAVIMVIPAVMLFGNQLNNSATQVTNTSQLDRLAGFLNSSVPGGPESSTAPHASSSPTGNPTAQTNPFLAELQGDQALETYQISYDAATGRIQINAPQAFHTDGANTTSAEGLVTQTLAQQLEAFSNSPLLSSENLAETDALRRRLRDLANEGYHLANRMEIYNNRPEYTANQGQLLDRYLDFVRDFGQLKTELNSQRTQNALGAEKATALNSIINDYSGIISNISYQNYVKPILTAHDRSYAGYNLVGTNVNVEGVSVELSPTITQQSAEAIQAAAN